MRSMETILQQLSLSLILLCLHPKSGHSALITYPRDTEVLVNQSTYFSCSTSIRSEQIHWYHYRVGENRTNYVYYKGQFNQNYADRYSIQINVDTGEYNLIIRSVQTADAGRHVCQDDGGLGNSSSAELVVLEYTPTCLSSMRPGEFVGPNSCNLPLETLQLSCSVSYNGNIPPLLQWKIDGNDAPISEGIATDYSGRRATVNLTMNSTVEMDYEFFTCIATRSRDKKLTCSTEPAKINYAVGQPTILNVAKGENITCSANASEPCTYRWLHGNDTQYPVSYNQVLTTGRFGNHSCEATCPINGINCTFVAMHAVVFEDEPSTASEENTKMLLIAILISTAVILLIIACVGLLFFRIRQRRIANRADMPKVTNTTDEVNEEGIPLYESKSASHGVEKKDSLAGDTSIYETNIKEETIITKATKEMGRAIAGVASLDDLLYVVCDNSSEVETYDASTFDFKDR